MSAAYISGPNHSDGKYASFQNKKKNLLHSLIFVHLILSEKDLHDQFSTKALLTNFTAQMAGGTHKSYNSQLN